jgi:hypothetical protein
LFPIACRKTALAVSVKSRFSLFCCFFDLRFVFGISNPATESTLRDILKFKQGRNYLLGQRFWRASARRFRRRSRSAFEYRLGTPRASFANALAAPLLISGT